MVLWDKVEFNVKFFEDSSPYYLFDNVHTRVRVSNDMFALCTVYFFSSNVHVHVLSVIWTPLSSDDEVALKGSLGCSLHVTLAVTGGSINIVEGWRFKSLVNSWISISEL